MALSAKEGKHEGAYVMGAKVGTSPAAGEGLPLMGRPTFGSRTCSFKVALVGAE